MARQGNYLKFTRNTRRRRRFDGHLLQVYLSHSVELFYLFPLRVDLLELVLRNVAGT